MGTNWLRTYTLVCGPPGGQGFLIGNTSSAEQTALHIAFEIEKSDSESANTAKLQVWNLSPENRTLLETKDCVVVLKAGYGMDDALILAGNIVEGISTLENADILTEASVVDGRVALRDTNLAISLTGVVNSKTIYDMVAKQMGVSIVYSQQAKFLTYPNGYSFVGKARLCLDALTAYNTHKWTLQNGVLQITNPNEPITAQGYKLSASTGLVGIPKRITIGSDSNAENNQTGYEIEYLLNGSIGVNDIVIIESKNVNGYFRVHSLKIKGDNLEGDWTCTAQVIQITQ